MHRIILGSLLFILAGCSTSRNTSPAPTPIPPSITAGEIEHILISCLNSTADQKQTNTGTPKSEPLYDDLGEGFIKKRFWNYEGRGDDVVYAGFSYRSHYMRVGISYSAENIVFSIIESRNLKQSETRIHNSALTWLGGLEQGIKSCLGEFDRKKYEHNLQTQETK